jgi:uncharacterized lipoprotein YbaY
MSDTGDGLVGREWVLAAIGGDAAATERRASVTFGTDGRFSGSTGVNRMFGGYRVDGGRLHVEGPGTTLMAGPPEEMAAESAFIRAFSAGGEITCSGDRLAIGPLTFRAAEHVVRVSVAYRERIAMPPGAVVVVTLADVSRADAAADVLATVRVDEPGNVPVNVQLPYDPERIDEHRTYGVRATIEVDGELWWTSTDAHLVLTGDAPDRVDVLLTRAVRPPGGTSTERVVRLVGVYDADSTVWGEVSYWVGARLGRRHCSLCDITHGSIRQRPEWTACQENLPTDFDTYHRNDQPDSVRAAAGGHAPVVVAETDSGRHVVVLTPEDLEACEGSIDRLTTAIERSLDQLGLTWGHE